MKVFIREFFDVPNNIKSVLGAISMGAFLVYENRANPFEMYAVALCGQFVYSFLVGNFWMSSYQTFKKKMPKSWLWRGILSGSCVAGVAGIVTCVVQIILMNPEAVATAWWAVRLSLFAFLFNEFLCWRAYQKAKK